MDLYHHDQPPFTLWVIEDGLLHEPFVVIDVGVQGGEHPRWELLGDQVRVYEGFDPEVLRGARTYLARSNILCVTVETDFDVSLIYPRTAFSEINDIVVQHRLLLFDLNCVRYSRPSYVAARAKHPWPPADPMHDTPYLDIGRPGTFDFLFCRDFVAEDVHPKKFARMPGAVTSPTVDKLIKSMINFELHGLMDCAVDLADHFRSLLQERLDVDEAIALLTRRPPFARNTADVIECLRMVQELRTDTARKAARVAELEVTLAAQRGEFEAKLVSQAAEFEAKLVSQAAEFDNKLRSVRFLSVTLRRELEGRARRRLGLAY